MPNTLRVLPVLVVLLAVAPSFAQKETVDPNSSRPRAAASKPSVAAAYDPARDPDKRMAQKVNCEALHARLSSVIGGVQAVTGVPISCGSNKNDWQVRDVPVTVYARDLPLGVLLRGLARATHNTITSVETDHGYAYRITQSARLRSQFAEYDALKEAYDKAAVWNQWEETVSVKDIPDAQFNPRTKSDVQWLRVVKGFSRLMSALGPSYQQRAVNGETIRLSLKDLPDDQRSAALSAVTASANLTAEQLDTARIEIAGLRANIYHWNYYTQPNGAQVGQRACDWSDNLGIYSHAGLAHPASLAKGQADARPPRVDDAEDAEFGPADVFALDRKVDLSDLASRNGVNFPALLLELAKRAGISLVVEDWDYYKSYPSMTQQFISKNVTVSWPLMFNSGICSPKWDKRDNFVLELSSDWVNKHLGLVPADVIDSLAAKLNGDGADLEDLLPALCLTPRQWSEWLSDSKELSVVDAHVSSRPGGPLWQFYAGLSGEDKALAASDSGLRLAKFDQREVSEMLKRMCGSQAGDPATIPALAKPEELVLHIVRQTTDLRKSSSVPMMVRRPVLPWEEDFQSIPSGTPLPPGLAVFSDYSLYISSVGDPRSKLLAGPTLLRLPFYSSMRRAELIESLSGTTAK